MRRKKILFLTVILLPLLVACHGKRDEAMLLRLQQWDKALDDNPEAIIDSLRQTDPADLSRANKAYYGLLKTIADDKTHAGFTSDSLINETERQLRRHQRGSELHMRSLIYQGIVRYRMGATDSTVFVPLKEAERIFMNHADQDPKIGYMMHHYLGKILEKNDNATQATSYYMRSLQMAEMEKSSSHVFDSTLALFWNQMRVNGQSNAELYLKQLEDHPNKSADEAYYFLNAKSAYLHSQKRHEEALEVNKKRTRLAPRIREKPEIFKLYYSISHDYLNLKQLDSAMFYIKKSMENTPDSNYVLNHLIYEKAAEISEVQNNYIAANEYRKKSIAARSKSITQEKSTDILELEKKYSHAAAENRVIKEKAKNRFYILLVLILLILLAALTNHLKQKKKRNKLIINSINKEKEARELRCKLLENEAENLRMEYEKKELTNEFYNQILNQFFELENELRAIADKSKLSNPDFADKIEELRNTKSKKLIDSFAEKITHKQFTTITGISLPGNITKSELLMLFLINCKLSNEEISIIFRATPASIRSRKHYLKKKMIESGADNPVF